MQEDYRDEMLDSSILDTVVDMIADDSGDKDDIHLQEDLTSYLQEPNLLL